MFDEVTGACCMKQTLRDSSRPFVWTSYPSWCNDALCVVYKKKKKNALREVFRFVTCTCCYFRTFIPDLPQHPPLPVKQGVTFAPHGGSLNLVGVRRGNGEETARVAMVTMILPPCDVTNHERARGAHATFPLGLHTANFRYCVITAHACMHASRSRRHYREMLRRDVISCGVHMAWYRFSK